MADDTDKPEKPSLPSDEDIAARFDKIRDQLKGAELPDLPDSEIDRLQSDIKLPIVDHDAVDERLRVLGARIQQTQGMVASATNKTSAKDLDEANRTSRSLAMGMTIASTIMGVPLMGIGIGWLIDWQLGTSFGKALGVVLGGILGMALAIKMANENAKKNQ